MMHIFPTANNGYARALRARVQSPIKPTKFTEYGKTRNDTLRNGELQKFDSEISIDAAETFSSKGVFQATQRIA
jgi:hypothetical protein